MRYFFLLIALVVLTGCSTVESRIKERPETYNNLSAKQKNLVSAGEVSEGMRPDAVYLAWGKPDQVFNGTERGDNVEEWIYEASRSEVSSRYRPQPIIYNRGGRYYGGWDYVFEPVIISHPYPYKSIRFENGKAVAWRRTPLR